MHTPGPVLWLMGPTSSGKTTLGEALVARLRDKGTPAILFDGDEVRRLIGVNGEYAVAENPDIVLDTESESVSVPVDELENFLPIEGGVPGLKIDRERAEMGPRPSGIKTHYLIFIRTLTEELDSQIGESLYYRQEEKR